MSRKINLDGPLSEADIKYLQARGRHAEIAKAGKNSAPAKATKPVESQEEPPAPKEGQRKLDKDVFEKVNKMSEEELKKELESQGLTATGDAKQLKTVLAQHLQKKKDSG